MAARGYIRGTLVFEIWVVSKGGGYLPLGFENATLLWFESHGRHREQLTYANLTTSLLNLIIIPCKWIADITPI